MKKWVKYLLTAVLLFAVLPSLPASAAGSGEAKFSGNGSSTTLSLAVEDSIAQDITSLQLQLLVEVTGGSMAPLEKGSGSEFTFSAAVESDEMEWAAERKGTEYVVTIVISGETHIFENGTLIPAGKGQVAKRELEIGTLTLSPQEKGGAFSAVVGLMPEEASGSLEEDGAEADVQEEAADRTPVLRYVEDNGIQTQELRMTNANEAELREGKAEENPVGPEIIPETPGPKPDESGTGGSEDANTGAGTGGSEDADTGAGAGGSEDADTGAGAGGSEDADTGAGAGGSEDANTGAGAGGSEDADTGAGAGGSEDADTGAGTGGSDANTGTGTGGSDTNINLGTDDTNTNDQGTGDSDTNIDLGTDDPDANDQTTDNPDANDQAADGSGPAPGGTTADWNTGDSGDNARPEEEEKLPAVNPPVVVSPTEAVPFDETAAPKLQISKPLAGSSRVRFKWTKVQGADGYDILQVKANGETKRIATVLAADGTVYETDLAYDKKYKFEIRAFKLNAANEKTYGESGNAKSVRTPEKKLDKPGGVKVQAASGSREITVTWKNVKDADGYQIYMRTGADGAFKLAETISGGKTTACTVTGKYAETYTIRVAAYQKNKKGSPAVFGNYSSEKSVTVAPARAGGITLKSKKKAQSRIVWAKTAKAEGYRLYRSTSENGKYTMIKDIKKGSKTDYTDKTVKSGREYYYKVRAYVTADDGKCVLGDSSAPKGILVK